MKKTNKTICLLLIAVSILCGHSFAEDGMENAGLEDAFEYVYTTLPEAPVTIEYRAATTSGYELIAEVSNKCMAAKEAASARCSVESACCNDKLEVKFAIRQDESGEYAEITLSLPAAARKTLADEIERTHKKCGELISTMREDGALRDGMSDQQIAQAIRAKVDSSVTIERRVGGGTLYGALTSGKCGSKNRKALYSALLLHATERLPTP